MVNESRIAIYEYLESLFKGLVNDNVYSMSVPVSNTESDTKDGFIVLLVGDLNDNSEFKDETYGWTRCFVTAYIPKKAKGYLNKTIYANYEDAINQKIEDTIKSEEDSDFYIIEDSIISLDDDTESQKGNQYHTFTKSFIVVTDKQI